MYVLNLMRWWLNYLSSLCKMNIVINCQIRNIIFKSHACMIIIFSSSDCYIWKCCRNKSNLNLKTKWWDMIISYGIFFYFLYAFNPIKDIPLQPPLFLFSFLIYDVHVCLSPSLTFPLFFILYIRFTYFLSV